MWLGTLCIFLCYLFTFSQSSVRSMVPALLYLCAGAVLSFGTVVLLSFFMTEGTRSWLFAVPIALLLLVANLLFGWNTELPFFLVMLFGVTADAVHSSAFRADGKEDSGKGILLAGIAGTVPYLIFSALCGVFA